jgi:uncharacterized membrane protein YbhN (UPF0104 family)
VEAALAAALAAVGLPLAAAATAVLACRLVSFWAGVAGGWVVFFFLRRRDRLFRQTQGRAAVSRAGTAERPVAGTGR